MSMLPTFLVGALAGAAVALLFAPASGRNSRAWLKDGARRLRDDAEHQVDRAQGAIEDGKSSVLDAMATGKSVLRDTVAAARDGYNKSREESSASSSKV
jgi:gas vesicle protein